jgi:methenyltetrahydromethanopterin cyclohydrolase
MNTSRVSVNKGAAGLVARMIEEADALRIGVERIDQGSVIIDAGIRYPGGLEAGRRIAEICMGGLGTVTFSVAAGPAPWHVDVHAANPVIACLGSQYAGWSLSHGEGKQAFHALGSGPARSIALKEELFRELDYRDQADSTCLVLEVDRAPPAEIVDKVARDCRLAHDKITFILTPTRSLAGMVQIVSRVLEVALHKVHALKFPLEHIVDGAGHAPVPPPASDFLSAMGRSNDAILFGGLVHLFVKGDETAARQLAQQLPASVSRDYGKPFAEVFKAVNYDFYQIDPMLFAPAEVIVTALDSGKSYTAGQRDEKLLKQSFGLTHG